MSAKRLPCLHLACQGAEERDALKSITHPVLVAFGLATLYLISLTGPIISPAHDLIYHLTGSATAVIVPVICFLLLLWLLLTGALLLARRRGRARAFVWSSLLLAIPPTIVHAWIVFADAHIPQAFTRSLALLCLLLALASLLLWRPALRTIDAVRPMASTLLGFFALAGIVIFAQLLYNAFAARNLNPAGEFSTLNSSIPPSPAASSLATRPSPSDPVSAAPGSAPPASSAPPHRILWVILDELSFQQLYERRDPTLDLPAFDRLAAQSTVFTHVLPTGDRTSSILPSLFTGLPADGIRVSASGHLLALHNPSGHWAGFDQHDTVFADAHRAGYTTAVAGWYNPYCRILPDVLDRCFWTYRQDTPADLSPHRSITQDLLRPLVRVRIAFDHLLGRGPAIPTAEVRDLRQHTRDYTSLVSAGDQLLADPGLTFVFLHLPIPHPYGFYDRRTHAFSTRHTSYLDNLALADLYLAHLRRELEQTHQWDSTTLLVMGDHSWRTAGIWRNSATWTAEDDRASQGGRFDPRPAVILKLPNQQTPARVDSAWDATHTRALLDALLTHEIATPADLETWLREKELSEKELRAKERN